MKVDFSEKNMEENQCVKNALIQRLFPIVQITVQRLRIKHILIILITVKRKVQIINLQTIIENNKHNTEHQQA